MNKTLLAAFLLLAAALLSAQDFNNALGPAIKTPGGTIFDEIPDPQERAEFRRVWDEKSPPTQRELGLGFVEQYPRSVLLREAYELIARASISAGRYAEGLDWARQALRLMPENPFLLVLIADISERQGQPELAETSARDALAYLERATAPAPIAPALWPKARNELRASVYFSIGRVMASRQRYEDALLSLRTGLSLHPTDVEAIYVYAVVLQATGQDEAAAAFARVVAADGPLAERSIQALRTLYARLPSSSTVTFAQYVRSLKWTAPAPPPPAPRTLAEGAYAGSAACRDCHSRVFDSWQKTGMASMLRPYRSSDVIGDFSTEETISGSARPVAADGRHFFEIRSGATGPWVRYPIDYVIGSKWQQAYATRLPDERLLVFPVQYSRVHSSWVNYWKLVDGPDSPRTDITLFHEKPQGAIYGETCAPCHTSQLRLKESSVTDQPIFREPGINCEMCHGPSLAHVQQMGSKNRDAIAHRESPPVRFRQLAAKEYVAICSQCHAQSAVHGAQAGGAINYSDHTSPFYRIYPAHLPSSFSRKAFYRDGRYRASTFIAEAFSRSACFRRGNATCGSCHDPHPVKTEDNPTSLKFEKDSNEMCLQCHKDFRERVTAHSRHAAGSEASRCVSCHMPKNMEALLFQSRSHEIDEIPDAEMTARFGNNDSPNACLSCHADRDTAWLSARMKEREK